MSDRAALVALESEWRSLAVSRGNAFVTPEWFFSWLDHYGDGSTPLVVVARGEKGELRGVVPLVLSDSRRRGVVRFAGSNLGDVFHPACAERDEPELIDATLAALGERRSDWSSLVLHGAGSKTNWQSHLARAGARLALSGGRPAPMPYIDLAGLSWDGYLAGRSRNFRSQLGAARRRLERSHDVTFRRTTAEADLSGDMTSFFDLHAARHATDSLLCDGRAQTFHRDFAARALANGWLRLSFLDIDGAPAAGLYCWRLGHRYSYYNGGFDARWAQSKVGFILLGRTIHDAIDEQAGEYDLLLGDKPYKRRFADAELTAQTLVITPSLHHQRLLFAAQRCTRRTVGALPTAVQQRLRRHTRPLARRLPTTRST